MKIRISGGGIVGLTALSEQSLNTPHHRPDTSGRRTALSASFDPRLLLVSVFARQTSCMAHVGTACELSSHRYQRKIHPRHWLRAVSLASNNGKWYFPLSFSISANGDARSFSVSVLRGSHSPSISLRSSIMLTQRVVLLYFSYINEEAERSCIS